MFSSKIFFKTSFIYFLQQNNFLQFNIVLILHCNGIVLWNMYMNVMLFEGFSMNTIQWYYLYYFSDTLLDMYHGILGYTQQYYSI